MLNSIETKFIEKIPQLLNLCKDPQCFFENLHLIPPEWETIKDEIDLMFSYKQNISETEYNLFNESAFENKIQQIFATTGIKVYAFCKDNLLATAEGITCEKRNVLWRLISAIPLDQVHNDLTFEQQWETERSKAEEILTEGDLSGIGLKPFLPAAISSTIISAQEVNSENLPMSTNSLGFFDHSNTNEPSSTAASSIQQELFLLKDKMADFVSRNPKQGVQIMYDFMQAVGITTQALSNVQQETTNQHVNLR
jgi:hypothetical protein